ncbi:MAG: carbamoyltransferase HypF [Spirochaetes bacterium RBG_13_51_14]|nr:MAG: carbamoyltransferase HypF [Spirochaetes bacterium RBG_13_51_14]
MSAGHTTEMKKALEIRIKGIVQGVGFRPFVYQTARRHRICGSVLNDTEGVIVRAEGEDRDLAEFLRDMSANPPPLAMVMSVDSVEAPAVGCADFVIEKSLMTAERFAFYSPDTAVCEPCRKEFFNPSDRRHLYPFITCINCGPRFSIVHDIPYDRINTSMAAFEQCDRCRAEYADPSDRRFHSQPNACPVCGPRISLYTARKELIETDSDEAARMTVSLLKQEKIIAIKGIGGYHLAADAKSDAALRELRMRKRRPFKPFALMAGSLESAERFLEISPVERDLLLSRERPIVLLKERRELVSRQAAPDLSYLGLMLPYTPFQHHLFSIDPDMVLVMTSGNVSDEPIEYRDETVFDRLGRIADYFVTYNREIIGQGDDSVLFVVDERSFFIRRSRGYVPAPFLSTESLATILAVGGDLKNSFAVARKSFIIMSQYLGDMADPLTYEVFRRTVDHFMRIFDARPEVIVSDMHPGYLTRLHAEEMASSGRRRIEVQHHHAHIAAVMEEHGITEPVIGIAYDGTGYGTDGTLWGSEFLIARRGSFERAAHFSNFPLPGGESAIRDVWKIGISLLHQRYGRDFPVMRRDAETAGVIEIIEKNINSSLACSIGRIFDGVAAILGISRTVSTEAEAAQQLEEAAMRGKAPDWPFIIPFADNETIVIGTDDLTAYIVSLVEKGIPAEDIAAAFHQAIIHTSTAVAVRLREKTGINVAALSGGVFHNRILLAGLMDRLRKAGFTVYTHTAVPCNDGCIALGQIVIAKDKFGK